MTKLEWANPKIIDMFTKEKVEETERRVTESVSEKIARNLLNKNLTVDEIAKATVLSVNHIKIIKYAKCLYYLLILSNINFFYLKI